MSFRFPGYWFMVERSGIRVSGSGVRVSRSWASTAEASGFGLRISGSGC